MRVATLLIYILFLLPGGNGYAISRTHQHILRYFLAVRVISNQRDTTISLAADYAELNNDSPETEEECFIEDEVEDGDATDFFIRKYKLLTQNFLSFLCPLAEEEHSWHSKSPPFSGDHLYYKYITQRVLRI